MPFSCSLSSTSCYCLATRSYRSVCMLIHTHHIPSKIVNKTAPFVQFLSPLPLFPFHLFSTTPLSYQHTLQSFSFSLDVFRSLPPNHTNQIAASITQIVVPVATIIITSTFTSTCHSFSNFDSTSAHLHSSITY